MYNQWIIINIMYYIYFLFNFFNTYMHNKKCKVYKLEANFFLTRCLCVCWTFSAHSPSSRTALQLFFFSLRPHITKKLSFPEAVTFFYHKKIIRKRISYINSTDILSSQSASFKMTCMHRAEIRKSLCTTYLLNQFIYFLHNGASIEKLHICRLYRMQ